jgi:hypothetical protein
VIIMPLFAGKHFNMPPRQCNSCGVVGSFAADSFVRLASKPIIYIFDGMFLMLVCKQELDLLHGKGSHCVGVVLES